MFGNQNKKRKIKRLQREKQRAKIKKAKAAAAAKKRQKKLAESQIDGEEDVVAQSISLNDVETSQDGAATESNEAIDSLPSEKEVAKAKAKTSTSRRKRKFLEKVMEKKEKKAKRQALFDSLSASKLSPTHSKLLVRSATLGQRETLRDALRRDLYFERAGLSVETSDSTATDQVVNTSVKNATKKMQRQEARKRRRQRKKLEKQLKMEEKQKQENSEKLDVEVSSSDESVEDFNLSERVVDSKLVASDGARVNEVNKIESLPNFSLKAPAVPSNEPKKKKEKFKVPKQTAFFVTVKRDPTIQEERMLLPVCGMEQEIIEAINDNLFVILCGETGSGKTTQLPQFLYESGFGDKNSANPGMIGVTQPRRVAAVTMASRIAKELNVKWGKDGTVAHQIRYDTKTVGDNTKLKLMTDGVLLREIRSDFLLRKYSIIIIDEAHERGVNTDLLIGLLSRIVPLRKKLALEQDNAKSNCSSLMIQPLRVVIMSATLNAGDFSDNLRLFPRVAKHGNEVVSIPKTIHVESRRYPITVHCNKRTATLNYLDATFRKVCKIHTKLPSGGILVFLTGKRDIEHFCDKVRKRFDPNYSSGSKTTTASREDKNKLLRRNNIDTYEDDNVGPELSLVQDGTKDFAEEAEAKLEDDSSEFDQFKDNLKNGLRDEVGDWELDDDDDFEEEEDVIILNKDSTDATSKKSGVEDHCSALNDSESNTESNIPTNILVLPLYAMLPQRQQLRVFDPVPPNTRLIVVSTNVAETSITIPGIKYVVDPGREKTRVYDQRTGSSKFEIDWVSKASASQSAGRCGRTGPGHCYRLYSSAMYNDNFKAQLEPEILGRPIEDLILNMKSMHINNIENFPFPTPPGDEDIKYAVDTLKCLGALAPPDESKDIVHRRASFQHKQHGNDSVITHVGEQMALFPLPPRFSKMLLLGLQQNNLMAYVISVVAALSVQSPFLGEIAKPFKHPESDALRLLRVVGAYSYTVENAGDKKKAANSFCKKYNLHARTMYEIQRLRRQLKNIISRTLVDNLLHENTTVSIPSALNLPPPTEDDEALIMQLIGASFVDRIARLAPEGTWLDKDESRKRMRCAYQSCNLKLANKPLWIHSTSGIASKDFRRLPRYVVYQEIVETSRPYMVCVTAISDDVIAMIGRHTPLVEFSAPLDMPMPAYDKKSDIVLCTSKPTFGPHRWELPATRIPIRETSQTSSSSYSGGANSEEIECRWFARLLFEGKVIGEGTFVTLQKLLSISPTIITHARFHKFSLSITQELLIANVSNLKTLKVALRKHPSMLIDTLCKFVNKNGAKSQVQDCWENCKRIILGHSDED